MEFRFVAYDADGKRRVGFMEAPDADAVLNALWAENLFPVRVSKVRPNPFQVDYDLSKYFGSVKPQEVAFLFRQLASVIRVGLPISQALAMQAEKTSNGRLRYVLNDIESRIRSGQAMWEALAAHPKEFKIMYTDMIRAADRGGFTADALERVAAHIEKEEEVRKKVRSALIYPSIVAVVGLIGIAALILFVLPRMKAMMESFNIELPFPTRVLLWLAQFAESHFGTALFVLVALAVVPWLVLRFPFGKRGWAYLRLRLPILKGLTKAMVIASFCRVLAENLAVGVPIAETIQSLESAIGNLYLRERFQAVTPLILAGQGISGPVEQAGIMPSEVISMLKIGEESGTLPQVCEELARFYENETDRALKVLTDAIEPTLVAVLGAIVAFIAIGIIAPIYMSYSSIG